MQRSSVSDPAANSPRPERIPLAQIVDIGEIRGRADAIELLRLPTRLEQRLDLGDAIEVVLERRLVAPRDHEHVRQARLDGFLDHVLDGGTVDDREHLLGNGFRRGQEPRPEARSWNNGLSDARGHRPYRMATECHRETLVHVARHCGTGSGFSPKLSPTRDGSLR